MPSLVAPVVSHAITAPDSVALRGPDGVITYRDLAARALEYGGLLRDRGVEPGDRVIFVGPSVDEFVIAYLGIQAAGATVVPVNPLCTASELEYFIADAEASLAIAWRGLDAPARAAAATAGIDFLELAPGAPTGGAAALSAPEERANDDVAAILYTSGTTGHPKGAELTVDNLQSAGRISAKLSNCSTDDRMGTALPLFHVFGQASVMLASLGAGASLTLVSPFTASGLIAAIVRDELTVVSGVPTMWNAMLHAGEDVSPDSLARLRLAVSGGASLAPEINAAFRRRFGCQITEGYGLTESTAIGTFSRLGSPAPRAPSGPRRSSWRCASAPPAPRRCPSASAARCTCAAPS